MKIKRKKVMNKKNPAIKKLSLAQKMLDFNLP